MKTAKRLSVRKLCWAILGRFEQLPKEEQESFGRVYSYMLPLARLTADNMAAPKEAARFGLEDLHDALGRELARRAEAARKRDRVARFLGPEYGMAQEFRDWLTATAEKHHKTVEQVAAWWLEYSDLCAGEGGQSALIFEFEQWYAAKLAA